MPGDAVTAWKERRPALLRWATTLSLVLMLLAGCALMGSYVHPHYPIQKWLFWRYAGYGFASLIWLASCVCAGHVTVKRVLGGRTLPFLEQLVVAFAAGLVWFTTVLNLLGFVGFLNSAAFVATPLILLVAGGRPTWRYLRRYGGQVSRAGGWRRGLTWIDGLAIVFGIGALALIYFSIITPKNIAFDARWKHLALAQHYVAAGSIERFPEGWVAASAPQLAARMYTWAFLLPVGKFFDRVELAAHLEFVGFAFSLLGIPALVRRLVPNVRSASSWATRFLFPGVFVYDSSLGGGADHVAAFFVAPVLLGLLRFWPRLCPRHACLMAFALAGLILTKYSAAFAVIVFPVVVIAARSLWLGVKRVRHRDDDRLRGLWLWGPLSCIGVGAIITSQLWLKNWIWYGDPLYPLLYKYFPARPWDSDAAWLYQHSYRTQHWKPKELSLDTVWNSVKVLFTFSFEPHDWKRFHGRVPVFGSLFTLTLLTLPWLGKRVRLWATFAAVHVGVMVWWWTNHQDRYLQTLVPWMAAATAAAMVLLWRKGRWVRAALVVLVTFQLAWGSDAYFIPSHAYTKVPAKASMDLVRQGYQKKYDRRFASFTWEKVAAALPPDARVLIHETHPHLGLQRQAVHDWVSWQAGINYGALGTPAKVDARLRSFGVSHVVWKTGKSRGYDSLAGDLLFRLYAHRYLKAPRKVGGLMVATPRKVPVSETEAFNDDVLFLGCKGHQSGLHKLRDLHVPSFGPGRFRLKDAYEKLTKTNHEELAKRAGFLVIQRRCQKKHAKRKVMARFGTMTKRKRFELYLKRVAR